jgi:hypothetical protein
VTRSAALVIDRPGKGAGLGREELGLGGTDGARGIDPGRPGPALRLSQRLAVGAEEEPDRGRAWSGGRYVSSIRCHAARAVPDLLLVTANPAKRIGVIADAELVAVGHNHSHVHLQSIPLCSQPQSRPYPGRPRRWAGRHLPDQRTTGQR